MASYNQITIIGNCGNTPELRYSPNGVPICNLNVAVNDPRLINGEWKDNTEWFRIICFNKLAERANDKVTKGMPVMVVGKLKLNRWDDKNTGEKRASLEILASRVINLAKSDKRDASDMVIPDVIPEDDIPPEGDINPEDVPF